MHAPKATDRNCFVIGTSCSDDYMRGSTKRSTLPLQSLFQIWSQRAENLARFRWKCHPEGRTGPSTRWLSAQANRSSGNRRAAQAALAVLLRCAGCAGALGGTRTPTILLTATSRQRVYQFRHERLGYRLEGCGLPDQRRRCNKSEMEGQGSFTTDLAT